jgi:hypothetical protein
VPGVLAVVALAATALAACASEPAHRSHHGPGQTAAQRRAAVDHSLSGTTTAGARHDARVLRVPVTSADPALKLEETCLGGGMLTGKVSFPGHQPAPFSEACGAPRNLPPLVAGVSLAPNRPRAGMVTVTVRPARGQDYWIGIGATTSS